MVGVFHRPFLVPNGGWTPIPHLFVFMAFAQAGLKNRPIYVAALANVKKEFIRMAIGAYAPTNSRREQRNRAIGLLDIWLVVGHLIQ